MYGMLTKVVKIRPISLLVLLLVCVLTSCITARKINYLQKSSAIIPSYNDSVGYEEYKIAPTDKLFIRVYSPDQKINMLYNGSSQSLGLGVGEYSDLYTYSVDEKGNIKLPIIGSLHVEGSSVRAAKEQIKKAIQATITYECDVYVKVVDRYFSIIGSNVNGRYPILREKMNIFQALAMAGDISTFGDRGSIKLMRETPAGTTVNVFDIRSKEIINSEYYYIQPNDVIYIQDVASQFFASTTLGGALATTFTTISFGILVYNLVKSQQPADTKTNSTKP